MIEYLRVGIIANSHGLRGEVKVIPTTEDINRFDYIENVILEGKGGKIEAKVKSVKYLNKFVVLGFEGYDKIDDILKFKNYDIMVRREDAIELGEDENFVGDLIGCEVYDDERTYGEVKDVLFTGANDVYVVDYEGRDILIPVIRSCVLDIDVENKKIKINMLEGLL